MIAELLVARDVVGVPLVWHITRDAILLRPRPATLADLLVGMLPVPDQFAIQGITSCDRGQDKRDPGVMHPIGGYRQNQRTHSGRKRHGGASDSIPAEQRAETVAGEPLLFSARETDGLPERAVNCYQRAVDKPRIGENETDIWLLLEEGLDPLDFFLFPAIVLIGKADNVAVTE